MSNDRLMRQIEFLAEADKLKAVIRRTPLGDASRPENSAEHSWHLAIAALALSEHTEGIDRCRVLELVAVHDLVEIDAGDTFAYDRDLDVHRTKAARERTAAARIFGILPRDQAQRLQALWEEFEAAETREAQFANALDRLQALVQNMLAGGGSWIEYHVTRPEVLRRMAPIEAAIPAAWPWVLDVVDRFCAAGAILEG
jgi:5'-deoxynucleotidase YfbR-like HD superfamily hydrolase